MTKFIKLNALIPADDCYEEADRRYVDSTLIRLDSIIGLSVSHIGYVYIRLISGDDLRVEVHNSLSKNAEDYVNILQRRLIDASSD